MCINTFKLLLDCRYTQSTSQANTKWQKIADRVIVTGHWSMHEWREQIFSCCQGFCTCMYIYTHTHARTVPQCSLSLSPFLSLIICHSPSFSYPFFPLSLHCILSFSASSAAFNQMLHNQACRLQEWDWSYRPTTCASINRNTTQTHKMLICLLYSQHSYTKPLIFLLNYIHSPSHSHTHTHPRTQLNPQTQIPVAEWG